MISNRVHGSLAFVGRSNSSFVMLDIARRFKWAEIPDLMPLDYLDHWDS